MFTSELIAEYVAVYVLWKLTKFYNIIEIPSQMLCNELFCEISHPVVQKWLLLKPELSLNF